jgi:hypothetical protein
MLQVRGTVLGKLQGKFCVHVNSERYRPNKRLSRKKNYFFVMKNLIYTHIVFIQRWL